MKRKDGGYSYQIKISNINYLYNSPNSLFFIYLEDKDLFIWEWIEDIVKEVNLNTYNESTITYRFTKILDEKSKIEIHEKIIRVSESLKEFSKVIKKRENLLVYKELDSHTIKVIEAFEKNFTDAKNYINNGNYTKALNIYKNISNLYEDKDIFLYIARLEIKLEKYNNAIKSFNKVIKLDKENKEALLGIIYSYSSIKQYEKEKKFIEKKLNRLEFVEIYCELANIYISQGIISNAIDLLKKALNIKCIYKENLYLPHLKLAEVYINLFNFTEAKKYIDLILKEDSKNSYAIALLGEYYFQEKNYKKAIDNFSLALEYDNRNYYCLRGLSLIYFKLNQQKKGLIYFRDFIKVLKNNKYEINKKYLIVYIGWKETIIINYKFDKDGFIIIGMGNNEIIRAPMENEDGKIFIGIYKDLNLNYDYPLVGKIYKNKSDYDSTVKNIKNKIFLMELSKGKGCHMEVEKKTNLSIEDKKNNVYIDMDFNGYNISGFTDLKNNKRGYKEFVRAYNKNKFCQISICCEESKEEFCYTINNDNIKIN